MKRLVGVLTVLDGWVVGSYGFKQWLPVGHIRHQIEELERWQVDEIALLDISHGAASDGGAAILESLRQVRPLTPILVGAGISSLADAARFLTGGADRVVLGSGAYSDPELVGTISSTYGDQAVVVAVPLVKRDRLMWMQPKTGGFKRASLLRKALPTAWRGEMLVMDVRADGGYDSFSMPLIDELSEIVPDMRAMIFGGFRDPEVAEAALEHQSVTAVCFGNSIHQRELFIPRMKAVLRHPTRPFGDLP